MRGDELGAQEFKREMRVNKKALKIMVMIVVTLSRPRSSNACVGQPGAPGIST